MTERTTKTMAAPKDCIMAPLLLQHPLFYFIVAPYRIIPRSNGHLFETSYFGHSEEDPVPLPVPVPVVTANQAHPNPNVLCRLLPSRHPQTTRGHHCLLPPRRIPNSHTRRATHLPLVTMTQASTRNKNLDHQSQLFHRCQRNLCLVDPMAI
ncbi:uncharacterized protein EI90DRAFT_1763718 [Cantharellus anzutake]|uniref:uncharacterized protein n=1 Tax=Cantharellus anzutake TaxID=1750568 RepID=UPI0019034B0E|nr:uncharacterized protein EI90DRAFT_1763718 [Cantharellus anzutake]KAF8341661.1 hypothetical protein EI90DRAFT_1763718 [Cantharellus anzutake]